MPNQNYFEPREELKMAQCDLSLSYSPCKTEERLCKFYHSWCPNCDKESPRKRSKSETCEFYKRKSKEYKCASRKVEWNQSCEECENMDFEYETKDVRLDTCRIRSNLCELPTTYITNNCQAIKVSNCSTDFIDSTVKSIKFIENSTKLNDLSTTDANFGIMVDRQRQERISKLFPQIEQSARNINGIVNKINQKKPHLSLLEPTTTAINIKKQPKINDVHKNKTMGTNKYVKSNEINIPGNKPQSYDAYQPKYNEFEHSSSHKSSIMPSWTSSKITPPNKHETGDSKFNSMYESIHYDTGSFFNKRIEVGSLKDRYLKEVEQLKVKLREIRHNTFDNHINGLPQQIKIENAITSPYMKDNSKMEKYKFNHLNNSTGAIPKSQNATPRKVGEVSQAKRPEKPIARFKSGTKVSLKIKPKLKKVPKSKVSISKASKVVLDVESEGSDSEDSEKDNALLEETESTDEISNSSSNKEFQLNNPSHFGSGDSFGWPIRKSLFAHIPPYLCFLSYDSSTSISLPNGSRFLKWKLSTITPLLVKKTLVNSGFRLVRKSNEWLGTWGKHMKSPLFRTLKESQKLNHFPGTFQIGRKDRLWRNFHKLIHKFGHKEFGFIPQTYVLPQDLKILKQHWHNKLDEGDEKFILKPPASARGAGIKVINRWAQLPKRMSLVVQEYIANPYLINGSKFDLRLYVLVTSFNPLRIYLYPDGLARFASVPYSSDSKDLCDRYMHLTNYSINKLSSMYTANEDANACKGHKWTISKLLEYMDKRGVDTVGLWKELKDVVVKTILSGESTIIPLCEENMMSRYNCYELFGVDVLLDAHLKCWILEVNISPSLHSQSPLDEHVKGPMIKSLFELVQFHVPEKIGKIPNRNTPQCYDPRIYSTALTRKEQNKHNFFAQSERREDYLEHILADLTGDDIRHLTQAEDELSVIGKFERIFPTARTYKYLNFMEARYYNRLFDAWETKYEKQRHLGIRKLQGLCEQKIHLKVPPPPPITKSVPNLNQIGEPNQPALIEDQASRLQVDDPPIHVEFNKPSTNESLKLKNSMDIKSLYNSLNMHLEQRNVIRPVSCSDYTQMCNL